jgi:phosphoribosylformylglycinamidine (FGAM) synthase PurS component
MDRGHMATKTGTTKPGPAGTAILEQLAELDVESISPATARKVLEFRFGASHHTRVKALSQKARAGTLIPAEQEELDEYIRVGTLLSILQSRARRALKAAGQAP